MSATVDLASTASSVLQPLAEAAVTAAIGILVPYILKRLNVANDSDLKDNLEKVLNAAAGGAYKYAASHEGGLANIAVNNGALADATNYVLGKVPDTLKALGVTPTAVTEMVDKRLGALLATDPTVTAGKPPAAVATRAVPPLVPVVPAPVPPVLRPVTPVVPLPPGAA